MHAFLRSSGSSRWQANTGRIGNVVKVYYFCLVYEKMEVGRGRFSPLFYWEYINGVEAFGNMGIFRQTVLAYLKCL